MVAFLRFFARRRAAPAPVPQPTLVLGTRARGRPGTPVTIGPQEVRSHWRLYGTSGYGKSLLEASLFLQLLQADEACSLVDPHRDLARDIVRLLCETGFYRDERAFRRLLYIDWSRTDRALPFNVLNQPTYSPHTLAQHVAEAIRRAFPSGPSGTTPLLDSILLPSLVVLIVNRRPLTDLVQLITEKTWRDGLLTRVPDREVVSFFHNRFDSWGTGATIESTARRLQLLTFHPVLRNTLGQVENALPIRALMDAGTSVIHDLGGLDAETMRLLGCLLTVCYEKAALSRVDATGSRRVHHLFLEEFPVFSTTAEEAFDHMLAQTRKYGLYVVLANQVNAQVGTLLQGALGNLGMEIAFRLSPTDARDAAPRFTRYDPRREKQASPDGRLAYMSRAEQVQETVSAFENLPRRHAYVRVDDRIEQIQTLTVPGANVSEQEVDDVLEKYARRLMRPMHSTPAEPPPPLPAPLAREVDVDEQRPIVATKKRGRGKR